MSLNKLGFIRKIISLSILNLVLLNSSFGCSCDSIPFNIAIDESTEIFYGKVIKIHETDQHLPTKIDGFSHSSTKTWCTTFEVIKKWKGSSKKVVEIYQEGTSCDVFFDFGQGYIVYAKNQKSVSTQENSIKLWTWLCSRTHPPFNDNYNRGWDDRKRLDQTFPNHIKTSKTLNFFEDYILKFLVLLSLFFAGILFEKKKQKLLTTLCIYLWGITP